MYGLSEINWIGMSISQCMKKLTRDVRYYLMGFHSTGCRKHWSNNSCYQKLIYIDFDLRSIKMFYTLLTCFLSFFFLRNAINFVIFKTSSLKCEFYDYVTKIICIMQIDSRKTSISDRNFELQRNVLKKK